MYVFDMTERFKYFYNASSVNTSPSDKRGGTRTVDLVWDVKLVITFTPHLLPPLTSVTPITTQTHGIQTGQGNQCEFLRVMFIRK